jgi:hypothetical protein
MYFEVGIHGKIMRTCSFCNSNDEERTYIEGNNAHICSECIKLMHDFVVVRGVQTVDDLEAIEPETNHETKIMSVRIKSESDRNNGNKEYIFSIHVDDDGVSSSVTHKGDDSSWEDETRNCLSVGAQYIFAKTLEELEYNVSDWGKGELERYFLDRFDELITLRNAGFISSHTGFDFCDNRESVEDDDSEDSFSPVEGYRKS